MNSLPYRHELAADESGAHVIPLQGLDVQNELSAARARRLRAAVSDCVTRLDAPQLDVGEARAALLEAVSLLARLEDELKKPRTAVDQTPANAVQAPTAVLEVSRSGRWLRTRYGAVDIGTRGAPRRVLKLLADKRMATPGVAATLEEVFEAGWPGEKVHPEACASRVYVALSTLRRIGLRGVLLRRDDGYLLDPAAPCARVEDRH